MSTLTPAAPSSIPAPARPQPPSPNSQGGLQVKLRRMIFAIVTGRSVLRPVFGVLRRHAPLLKLGSRVIVTRYDDVQDVLSRDAEFTISEVNGPGIERINGPFILSMDKGPEYDRDHAALRAAARRDDLERVRAITREAAERCVEAARPQGRIEAVQGLTRAVPAELVERYFGFPGPDRPTLVRWLRNLFQDAFVNPGNDPFVRQAALRDAAELGAWVVEEIARRRAAGVEGAEDVMGRLIAMQGPERPWANDDWVRRNIAGLVVGAVDTQSRFSAQAVDELLRRPQELAGARAAAQAGDLELLRRYLWEAVRFNPHTTLMARRSRGEAVIAPGTPRERRTAAGMSMMIAPIAATFDPAAFPEPGRFRTDRDVRSYLHFGWGLHQCFGLGLNLVVIPEILAPLLRLPSLRRAPGRDGRVRLDGPFPDRLVLEFG